MSAVEAVLDGPNGPVVKVWGDVPPEHVQASVPRGWAVDWETSPAPLNTTRDGEKGFAHPLYRTTTPQAQRSRKMVTVTLSDSGRERLRELAERSGQPASRVVEELILAAPLPRRR